MYYTGSHPELFLCVVCEDLESLDLYQTRCQNFKRGVGLIWEKGSPLGGYSCINVVHGLSQVKSSDLLLQEFQNSVVHNSSKTTHGAVHFHAAYLLCDLILISTPMLCVVIVFSPGQ